MRKESRAMDSQWALEAMHKAPYITVSFIDEDGKPYGLPLSLASDDDVNWYFHGALEGKKLEAIKAHPEVCLSAVTRCAPTVGPKDGSFTLQFKSAIAFGKAEIGAVIMPPVPAFYHRPQSLDDVINQTVNRVLDQFAITLPEDLFARWQGA